MNPLELASSACLLAGAAFFMAGTVGLLRFPDVYTRLHALSKIDNLGLGLTVLGLVLRADSLMRAMKLLLVWLLALAAGATVSFLVAHRARQRGIAHWQAHDERRRL